MRMVAGVLLVSWVRAEGGKVAPEVIANVSMLLAAFHEVDCVQIFRTDVLPLAKVEEIHKMWRRLAAVESKVTTGVYSYRRYLEKKTVRPRKVSCYRSLKIMWDDEEDRRGYAKFSMKFSLKDAIWVLFTDSFSVKFFQNARVVFDDVILIAELKSEEVIVFHEVYKVAADTPLRVHLLGNWTKARGLLVSQQGIYDRRSNLEGVVLRTASTQLWPAAYFEGGKWRGFLIELWNEIQSLINCTSVDVKAENSVGMRQENGSWNGLVGMAIRNEIDVLVTEVVIDKERSRALDFLHPITKSSFQIYTRHLGYRWQWASILKPFRGSVWSAAVGWILVATLLCTFIQLACATHGLDFMDFGRFSPLSSFFFVMQALCQQGYHHSPPSYAGRVFFFVSYAVSSVLIPSYSASLVSSLSQKIHFKSFDSLQEMVADGSYRLMVKENTAQHAFFVHSNSELFKLAYEKLVKPVPEEMKKFGVRQSVKALCQLDKFAMMGIENIVEGRLHHLISLDCPVVPLTNPVSTVYMTMATAKNNPYWGLINHHLGKLLNTGVVERLRRSAFPPDKTSAYTQAKSEVEVGMRQVVSSFVFIGGFAVTSLLLLLAELLYHCLRDFKNSTKRKKRSLRLDHPNGRLQFEMKLQRHAKTQPRGAASPNLFFN